MNEKLGELDFRTDLAIECNECYEDTQIDGVTVSSCCYENNDIIKTVVEIESEYGKTMLGKPLGTYVTIESKKLKDGDVNIHNKIIEILVESLRDICDFNTVNNILVVGLGNLYVTPDSLGQKVVQKLLITRPFFEMNQEKIHGIKKVSAVAPGVMGQTGIETARIVKTIANEIQADLVIVIDALCARNVERLNKTIQISNTGISPGSGVGNKKAVISEEYIGSKVVSIGVPTVIDSKMLIKNELEAIFSDKCNNLDKFGLSNNLKNDIILEVLDNSKLDMFVSPKEIDEVIVRLLGIISRGLNRAIHDGLTNDEITSLLY